jgi:superfamily II DNA/RNA helicase
MRTVPQMFQVGVPVFLLLLLAQLFRESASFSPSLSQYADGNRHHRHQYQRGLTTMPTTTTTTALWMVSKSSDKDALQRTADQLERMKNQETATLSEDAEDEFDVILQHYLHQPANSLKQELKQRNLPVRGTKPDLANRLAEHDLLSKRRGTRLLQDEYDDEENIETWNPEESNQEGQQYQKQKPLKTFCGLKLSSAAGQALGKANFRKPSPIQKSSIPSLVGRESLILHAETGSGKTLAYLLPLTEQLWLEHNEDIEGGYGFILTPTRELAAQVAGVATVLAPPGSVRMVSRATNLMNDGLRDRGEEHEGGILDNGEGRKPPRLFIGSAKAIMHSLYGDGKMPASPTRKPKAQHLLTNTRWVVLDEVDRLLAGKKNKGSSNNRHEKPAAVVTSAVARLTLGRVQVIAASATVGRTLKRELSRVLGLEPRDCPRVVCSSNNLPDADDDNGDDRDDEEDTTGRHIGRAVKIPETVQHYVTEVDTSSMGKVLTSAFYVLKALNENKSNRRILFVLTKTCNINTQNAIGALKHFGCQPEPRSLLDALEADGGTNDMIEMHRQVSGATGVGQSSYFGGKDNNGEGKDGNDDSSSEGYLLVTGEDTIRGLHLDGLDVVVVVGRANGPDEYTHIAGRTGRAGRPGKVINVLSQKDTAALTGWEKMLDVEFAPIDTDGIAELD